IGEIFAESNDAIIIQLL
ncbi:unnamed protein product, partial [Rotaria sordida]